MTTLSIIPLSGLPAIQPDCDLAAEIHAAMDRQGVTLEDGDIVVMAQKIISKSEGRRVPLSNFSPSSAALELAARISKDPHYVEAVLSESNAIIRTAPNLLITEHRLGHIMANAGIDQSNIEDGDHSVLLLPVDPDASARTLRTQLAPNSSPRIGIIISDSFGRPWRVGTTGVAIGLAGVPAAIDKRGQTDMFGRTLKATEIAFADSVATAAVLVMGETDEGTPVAIVRGVAWEESTQTSLNGLRSAAMDLFR